MSMSAMSWAYSISDLSASQKFLLVTIANYADEEDRCFPGIDRLSKDCSMGRRTVIRAINELQEKGLLTVEKRGGHGTGRKSNRYKLEQSANLAHSHEQSANLTEQCANLSKQCATVAPYPTVNPKKNPPIVPPNVDQEAWVDLCEYRETHKQKKIRDSWTDLAKRKAGKLLAELSADEQKRCVDLTICNGWQGIFPERLKNGSHIKPNGKQTASQIHKGIYEDIAVGGSLDRGAIREDEITLPALMDEANRRCKGRH